MTSVKDTLYNILKVINVFVILGMLITGYAYIFNPLNHSILATGYLAFPIFIGMNFVFLLFWAFTKLKYAIFPFIGFVICYHPVRLYMPLNVSTDEEKGDLKVLSYNTEVFGALVSAENKATRDSILDYIVKANADVVCLQESQNWFGDNKIDSTLKAHYAYDYQDYSHSKDNRVWILSRYPIEKTYRIDYKSYGNLSIATQLKTPQGSVLLVNNHFESNALTPEDKKDFKGILTGKVRNKAAGKEGLFLFKKLAVATERRAIQVEAVSRFLASHQELPTIVCGDFNEGPNGYAVNKLSKNLKSAFVETGNLFGWSYHRSGMYVRIDHILYSEHFTSLQTKVDDNITESDHYPIISTLIFDK